MSPSICLCECTYCCICKTVPPVSDNEPNRKIPTEPEKNYGELSLIPHDPRLSRLNYCKYISKLKDLGGWKKKKKKICACSFVYDWKISKLEYSILMSVQICNISLKLYSHRSLKFKGYISIPKPKILGKKELGRLSKKPC